jgi:hypothetical protein
VRAQCVTITGRGREGKRPATEETHGRPRPARQRLSTPRPAPPMGQQLGGSFGEANPPAGSPRPPGETRGTPCASLAPLIFTRASTSPPNSKPPPSCQPNRGSRCNPPRQSAVATHPGGACEFAQLRPGVSPRTPQSRLGVLHLLRLNSGALVIHRAIAAIFETPEGPRCVQRLRSELRSAPGRAGGESRRIRQSRHPWARQWQT